MSIVVRKTRPKMRRYEPGPAPAEPRGFRVLLRVRPKDERITQEFLVRPYEGPLRPGEHGPLLDSWGYQYSRTVAPNPDWRENLIHAGRWR